MNDHAIRMLCRRRAAGASGGRHPVGPGGPCHRHGDPGRRARAVTGELERVHRAGRRRCSRLSVTVAGEPARDSESVRRPLSPSRTVTVTVRPGLAAAGSYPTVTERLVTGTVIVSSEGHGPPAASRLCRSVA